MSVDYIIITLQIYLYPSMIITTVQTLKNTQKIYFEKNSFTAK